MSNSPQSFWRRFTSALTGLDALSAFSRYLRGSNGKESNPILARKTGSGTQPTEKEFACVFEGEQLRDITSTRPSRPLSKREILWLCPKNDIPLSIPLSSAGSENIFEASLQIRFEPEMGLGIYLCDKDSVRLSDLRALVAGELTRLIPDPPAESFSAEDNERNRASLSRALSEKGFRCTGFSLAVSKPDAAADAKEETETPNETETLTEAKKELERKMEEIKSNEDWDSFKELLRASGIPATNETDQELQSLGGSLLNGTVSSAQCSEKICRMAKNAADKAGIAAPDLSFWENLFARLDSVADETKDVEIEKTDDKRGLPSTPAVQNDAKIRPAFKMITDPLVFESRLRIFLHRKVQASLGMIQLLKPKIKDIHDMVFLREIDDEVSRLLGLLETAPKRSFAEKRAFVDASVCTEFFQEMDRAIAAAESLETALMKGPAAVSSAQNEIRSSLDALTAWANRVVNG